MNRRQKKKQFKKIYGMNPKEYERLQDEWRREFLSDPGKHMAEALTRLRQQAIEAAEIIKRRCAEMAEILRREGKRNANGMANFEVDRHGLPDSVGGHCVGDPDRLPGGSDKECN